jgi:hypothetical protein
VRPSTGLFFSPAGKEREMGIPPFEIEVLTAERRNENE